MTSIDAGDPTPFAKFKVGDDKLLYTYADPVRITTTAADEIAPLKINLKFNADFTSANSDTLVIVSDKAIAAPTMTGYAGVENTYMRCVWKKISDSSELLAESCAISGGNTITVKPPPGGSIPAATEYELTVTSINSDEEQQGVKWTLLGEHILDLNATINGSSYVGRTYVEVLPPKWDLALIWSPHFQENDKTVVRVGVFSSGLNYTSSDKIVVIEFLNDSTVFADDLSMQVNGASVGDM